jgi:hypothetical protein
MIGHPMPKAAPKSPQERTKGDPSTNYACPEDVVADAALSKKQKIEILQRWEYDSRDMAVAAEEGMTGPGGDLLRRIKLTLAKLTDGNGGAETTAPNKQHGASPSLAKPKH